MSFQQRSFSLVWLKRGTADVNDEYETRKKSQKKKCKRELLERRLTDRPRGYVRRASPACFFSRATEYLDPSVLCVCVCVRWRRTLDRFYSQSMDRSEEQVRS